MIDGRKAAVVFNRIYTVRKYQAKRRGIPFDLSHAELLAVILLPCFYCGAAPDQIGSRSLNPDGGIIRFSGVDRLNNALGYSRSNCVPCCKLCNNRKERKGILECEDWMGPGTLPALLDKVAASEILR